MAFAIAEDVATRLGRTLTTVEAATVDQLLDQATGTIAAAADKTDQWAAALNPVPQILWAMTIELVVRSIGNTGGLRSESETLGQYQSSRSFAEPGKGGGMLLSDLEERVIRRAVYGRTSGSAKTESLATEIADLVLGCGS